MPRVIKPGLMRLISSFPKADVAALSQTLSRFEANISAAIDDLAQGLLPAPWVLPQTEADVILRVSEVCKVNTPAATSVVVHMPQATATNAGQWCGIIRVTGSGSIYARGATGQLVQGVASDALPATRRLYYYVSDGEGWWRT